VPVTPALPAVTKQTLSAVGRRYGQPSFFFPAPRNTNGRPFVQAHTDDILAALNKSCGDKAMSNPVSEIRLEQRTEAMYYRKTSRAFLRVLLQAQEKMRKVVDKMGEMAAGGEGPDGLLWPPGAGEKAQYNCS
jgi:hypothetical protein